MPTTLRKPRKKLSVDTLAVETFAPQPQLVEEVVAQWSQTACHFTGRDSTCPCCSDPFTCPCSYPNC